jgi:5-methylcytosine-specific restriction endonuclease McrA
LSPSQIEEGQLRAEAETRRLEQSAGEENLEVQVRQPIPSAVRREVWRRDQGKCARCGSREKLEYDHIVPVARGGSNTARNIELLCESCNRSKSHSIQ